MKTTFKQAFSLGLVVATTLVGCSGTKKDAADQVKAKPIPLAPEKPVVIKPAKYLSGFYPKLSRAALERTKHHVVYDGSYQKIDYPWGDVAPDRGVCTDVVIRSYRKLGIDLQQLVHEDRNYHPYAYPDLSKRQAKPNTDIDHRRVRNLRPFFERNGQSLPITQNPSHYRPGDIVTWTLPTGMDHIGIVVNKRSPKDPNRYMIVHNVGEGPKLEDVLFSYRIDGHYRFLGSELL